MSLSPDELKKLKALPIMKELKKVYDANPQLQGSGRRIKIRGGSFWDDVGNWFKQAAIDVDNWAKKVKPITALSKAAGLIGLVPGLNEVALLAPGIKGVAEFTGYGRKKGGRKSFNANSLGQHVNPVAGKRGFVSHGMGTMTQNYQSPALRKIGGATYPSHLQPFLTSKRIAGGSAALAVGSIGNPVRIK